MVAPCPAVTEAVTTILPVTFKPFDGEVIRTIGLVGMTLFTLTEIDWLPILAPLSVATTWTV